MHSICKNSPHVVLRDHDAHRWPAAEPPAPADELELGLDVVGEEGHVVGEVKLGRGEDQRVAHDGLAGQAVNLGEVI